MLRIFIVVLLVGFAIAKNKTACRICKAKLPTNCIEAVKYHNCYGKLLIKLNDINIPDPFPVQCVPHPSDLPGRIRDPWNIVLRREWGDTSFTRSWDDYKNGFGSLFDDFFIGLDKLYALTNASVNELWVQMEDWKRNKRWVMYKNFTIGDEDEGYAITSLGKPYGIVRDNLRYHVGSKFSTYDKDNDNNDKVNCAELHSSGWWFNDCNITGNFNGLYLKGKYVAKYFHGIVWRDFQGLQYSLRYAHFAIRAKRS